MAAFGITGDPLVPRRAPRDSTEGRLVSKARRQSPTAPPPAEDAADAGGKRLQHRSSTIRGRRASVAGRQTDEDEQQKQDPGEQALKPRLLRSSRSLAPTDNQKGGEDENLREQPEEPARGLSSKRTRSAQAGNDAKSHVEDGKVKQQRAPARLARGRASHTSEDAAAVEAPAGALVSQESKWQAAKRKQSGGTTAAGPVATREMEQSLWAEGFTFVVGVDEAGRGPLAGPVVAAACCLPPGAEGALRAVADSKALDEAMREELYAQITSTPEVVWAAHVVDHVTIDRINILAATMLAMKEATLKLPADRRDVVLVDGNRVPEGLPIPCKAVVKGDASVFCIAAASILAKVTRDRIMMQLDVEYPIYGFARHKGYGVPEHRAAIVLHGPCGIHRRSFQPIRGMTGWTRDAQLEQERQQEQAEQQVVKL